MLDLKNSFHDHDPNNKNVNDQAEFGDHDPEKHTAEYLKDFPLLPKPMISHFEDRLTYFYLFISDQIKTFPTDSKFPSLMNNSFSPWPWKFLLQ